jgi:16S rRNA (guanine527-N7)-methyltransferase
MQMKETLLLKGIHVLQQNDTDIERLIAPRKDAIISLLERYIKEIELFNTAYGLVGAKDTEELVIKHILDSLAPLGILSRLFSREPSQEAQLSRIADAGSGAGLPGIPLAIAMPCEFSLIERMGRRVGFLCNTKAVLSLSNITVEESEIEKAAPQRFDLVTFRAFKPLEPKLLKTLFNLCVPGGFIAAYKGRREKIEAEMAALHTADIQWEAVPYTVPFLEEERHILIMRTSKN